MSSPTANTRPGSEPLPTLVRSRADLVAIGLLLAVSLATRLQHLFRPLHGDEMISFSNMVLLRDFTGILFGPFDSNSHLLNSLIMKAVYLLAGENPALMRLPNLAFGLLAVVLLYSLGSRVLGRIGGFAAALIFSFHPAMVLYSVSARGYSGMVLFTLASSVFFLAVLRSFSWPKVWLCAMTGFVAAAFHLFAVNVLIAQVLVAVIVAVWPVKADAENMRARAGRVGPVLIGPVIALGLVPMVFLPSMLQETTEKSDFFFQAAFPVALVNFLGGFRYRTDPDMFSLLLLALTVVGFLGLAKQRTLGVYLGLLFLSPVSLWVLSIFARFYTLHPRFFVFLLPFSCLLVIAGLQRIARVFGGGTGDDRHGSTRIAAAVLLFALIVGAVFFDRIKVPRGSRALTRAQRAVGEVLDAHPAARILTNDTGFVRVRLRQEGNLDRIRPALGIIAIEEDLQLRPSVPVLYIYVPQKRLTESDLIHYQGKVPPEVKYERDERLRGYLEGNATLELDLAPMVQIYSLRSADQIPKLRQ